MAPPTYDLPPPTSSPQTGHAFTDEPLKGMYEVEGILGSPNNFFAHTAHLYVRFAREEMAKIKSCQLQVQLFNSGIKEALHKGDVLKDRRYHNHYNFPTLNTPDMTWVKRNFPVSKGERSGRGGARQTERARTRSSLIPHPLIPSSPHPFILSLPLVPTPVPLTLPWSPP